MPTADPEMLARQRALVGRFRDLSNAMEEEGVPDVHIYAAALSFFASCVIRRGRDEEPFVRQAQIQGAMLMLHDTCQLGYHSLGMADPLPKGTKIH